MSNLYADLDPKERTALKINYVLAVNRAPDMSSTARRVAIALTLDHLHNSETNDLCGFAWPSQETLAAELGRGLRTIQDALTELDARGWLLRWRKRHYYYQPNWNHPPIEAQKPAPSDTQETAPSNAQKPAPLEHGENWDTQIPSLQGAETCVSKAQKSAPNNLDYNLETITGRARVIAPASPPDLGSRNIARSGSRGEIECTDGNHFADPTTAADIQEGEIGNISPASAAPKPAERPVKEEVQPPGERQLVRRMIDLELVDDQDAGWRKLNDMDPREVFKLKTANLAGRLSPAALAEALGTELRAAL